MIKVPFTPHQFGDFVGLLFKPLTYEFEVGGHKVDVLDIIITILGVSLFTFGIINFELSGFLESLF